MRASAVAMLGVGLALSGCDGDRPSHAAIDSIGLDADARARFGDASGDADWNPGIGSAEQYRKSLVEKLAAAEARLRDQPSQATLELSVQRLRDQLDTADAGYANHSGLRRNARTRVRAFLVRFAPDLEWEADYALGAGDLSLTSSLVQDVADRLRRLASGGAGASNSKAPSPADVRAAEQMAAEAFLYLGRLAENSADFDAAERNYRLAGAYDPGSATAIEAALTQDALLLELGRGRPR